MTKNILAIIPARGGSKGLPRKNILDLGGKPLIAWTIEASLSSKFITKTVVSSDDNEILKISKQYKSDVIKRPSYLAQDDSSSEAVVNHVINELKKENQFFAYIVLLQPTSPLRDGENIDAAFEMLFYSDATALISVNEIDNKILKAFKDKEDGYIEGVSNNTYPFMRRQDLPKTYLSNGSIYIIEGKAFSKSKRFYTDKTVKYIMDGIRSLDVDTASDLRKVKKHVK